MGFPTGWTKALYTLKSVRGAVIYKRVRPAPLPPPPSPRAAL